MSIRETAWNGTGISQKEIAQNVSLHVRGIVWNGTGTSLVWNGTGTSLVWNGTGTRTSLNRVGNDNYMYVLFSGGSSLDLQQVLTLPPTDIKEGIY